MSRTTAKIKLLYQALTMHAEDAVRKVADDTARQANSGQNVQDEQDDGQNMNEDPDSVQPAPQDFRYPWKLEVRHLAGDKRQGRWNTLPRQ